MPPEHIKPLTGIRGIAALTIAMHHIHVQFANNGAPAWIWAPLEHAYLAVPFFFILSGFILSYVYFPTYRGSAPGAFIWARFARIWPVHFAMLAVTLLYVACLTIARGYVADHHFPFNKLVPELLMVRSWYDDKLMAWNGPAWSIQAEWFAYLFVFPLCAWVLRPITSRWLLGVIVAAVLLGHPYLKPAMPGPIFLIVCTFIAGSAIYRIKALTPELPHAGLLATLGTVASIGTTVLNWVPACYFAYGVLIFALSYQVGAVSRFLSTRAMIYAGNVSFSLYMSHWITYIWVEQICKNLKITGWPVITGDIVAALIVAHLVWKFVEVPANGWLRKRHAAKRASALKAATATAS